MQNLSHRLVGLLADVYPGSVHVREVGLETADDAEVWTYAAHQGFLIVTKDADFRQRSFLQGHPPKVVWLCVGNCSTTRIEVLLRSHQADLLAFAADATTSVLVLA